MKKFLFAASLVITTLVSSAQENPLWMRYSKISPDGNFIAFAYKGDIYKVPTSGGQAVRLTTNEAYDSNPIWSADSKQIAFSSDREGGFIRLFVMSSNGGAAKQLSFHSNAATPQFFSKDGKFVYYTASLQNYSQSALYPMGRFNQLYKVSVTGGVPEKVLAEPMDRANLSADGNTIVYQDIKGFENKWRKHHTSAVTRNIWKYDFKAKKHSLLVDWKGEDLEPVLSADGKSLFFLSERSGSLNVFKADVNNPSSPTQITSFTDSPVRFLSVANDGTISFVFDGELYTAKNNAKPNKVNVTILNDLKSNSVKDLSFTRGATSATVSPDGKQIAFSVRGEIFVTSVDYTTTKQITKTAAAEVNPTFSSDGKSLVYSSYRDGKWDLYKATIGRKEDPDFAHAMVINEEKLINDNTEKTCPKFSPDGKEVAFVLNRTQLAVYNIASKKVRTITPEGFQPEKHGDIVYSWSPDSKWFAVEYYARFHAPFSDVGIVSAEGGKDVFNITNGAYFNLNPKWAMDGNAIVWNSDRYGMKNQASWGSMQDEMIVFLNKEAFNKYQMDKEEFELYSDAEKKAEKEKKDAEDKAKKNSKDAKKDDKKKDKAIVIEFDNMDSRIVKLTPNSSDMADAIVNKDGTKMYYLAAFEEGYDLWVTDLREKSTKLLTKLNGSSVFFNMDKDGKNIFILGSKSMQKLDTSSEKLKGISFNASMKLDPVKEREFMLQMVRNEVKERFYVKDLHGVKWDAIIDHYKTFLPHINNNYDFSEMLSEILGELNVSHTGSGYYGDVNGKPTAQLGVFFTSTDKGLVIDEVVVNGPFDNFKSKAKKGTIIEKIDGQDVNFQNDYNTLLEGKAGKKVLITLYDGNRWEEVITPISNGAWNALLSARWKKQRAADVEKWSNGKLGYVHISSMNDASFRQAYNDAMGKYYDKEGIVVDIRYNGGGRLHEDVEVLFSGKKYLTQYIQGKRYAEMPSRRWNKKSIMLMNEACYSNAHGTPWVYKTMGLGKLVGSPVAGTMTSVNWVDLQDSSMYFGIPVIGYMTAEGKYLENSELQPDILIPYDFQKGNQGEDVQLKMAVEELLKEKNK